MAASPPHATSLSKNCARNSTPSTAAVATAPVDARERPRDWVVGGELLERPQHRGRGEQVVRRQLEQVHTLGERGPGDGDRGDARRVAGEHVDEPRRERAHPPLASARVDHRRPAVEAITTDLLLDLELERRTLEHSAQRVGTPPRECAGRAGSPRCSPRAPAPCTRCTSGSRCCPSSTRKSMISSTGTSNAGPGLDTRPDQLVEVELRGEEARLDVILRRRTRRSSSVPCTKCGTDSNVVVGAWRAHPMLPRTKASMVPAQVNLSSPPSRSV